MESFRKSISRARQRVNPDGLAASSVIALSASLFVPETQIFFTTTFHELARGLTTEQVIPLAVGLIGVSTLASIAVDAKTLLGKKFSSNPVSTLSYTFINNPVLASSAAHVANLVKANVFNPIHVAVALASLSGDGRLFFENTASFALTVGLWHIATNLLILNNKEKKFTDAMITVRTGIKDRLSRRNKD